MEFSSLPAEIILKIFFYLTQSELTIIARVSEAWKQLAFDPILWTEISIDAEASRSERYVREVLDRALLIRRLDISVGSVDLQTVASSSHHFKMMKELLIPSYALSHHATPTILANSTSLSKLSLTGRGSLLPSDVRTMESLHHLKYLAAAVTIHMSDDVLRQICVSFPKLEYLQLYSGDISRRDAWESLERLKLLRSLSVTRISTGALFHASRSCPTLETLEIHTIWNENNVSVAQSLRGFKALKSLTVEHDCGGGWFNADFRMPPLLERLDVPKLRPEEEQVGQLVRLWSETLRHISISVPLLREAALGQLLAFQNLETICVHAASGLVLILPVFAKLPKLVSLEVHVVEYAEKAIVQLTSIVDVLDRSKGGYTQLVIEMRSSSQWSVDVKFREVYIFKEYLSLNTCLSIQHIRDLEQQWWRLKETKMSWLALEGGANRVQPSKNVGGNGNENAIGGGGGQQTQANIALEWYWEQIHVPLPNPV